jgi:hypothetical protein
MTNGAGPEWPAPSHGRRPRCHGEERGALRARLAGMRGNPSPGFLRAMTTRRNDKKINKETSS